MDVVVGVAPTVRTRARGVERDGKKGCEWMVLVTARRASNS